MINRINYQNYSFLIRDHEEDPSYQQDLDFKVIAETWNENVYRIYQDQLKESRVFVDIGANIGSVSIFVDSFNKERERHEKIRVYAIEPEPHNLDLLRQNVSNNPIQNITIVDKAIWHEQKTLEISHRGGNSSVVNLDNQEKTLVEAITMQDFFSLHNIDQVDVMKIDIEGAEFDLIINTPPEVLSKIKRIVLEFDKSFDGKFGKMVEKLAKQFGLDILGSPERGGYIYANRY